MEATQRRGQLRSLITNVRTGLFLVTGRRLSGDDFVYSLEQGLLLLSLAILLELLAAFLVTEQPAVFSAYGLNYLGAAYFLDIAVLLLIARLARTEATMAGRLILAALACSPPVILISYLFGLLQYDSTAGMHVVWVLWLIPLIWQIYILYRLLRTLLDIRLGKSLLLAGLQTAVGVSSLWILPYSVLWYTDEPDDAGDSPYTTLYELSLEDLFYDQPRLIDGAVTQLAPQRPGVTDLYLLAAGGYGLERVFLNEVEYVRELFDARFDTRNRSVVLVNNASTVSRYAMMNRHNLSAVLAGFAERMDLEEDMLFLYMTSHGSEDHRFSLYFGPIRLNDLDPVQVRQALDEAGIRWRVIVASSCYSGGFIEPLRDPNTMIVTAAAADRQSFGCGPTSEFTDFATAYFRHALKTQSDFIAAFDIAAEWVADKERRERRQASQPQRFVGEAIRPKLAVYRQALRTRTAVASRQESVNACQAVTPAAPCLD